MKVFSFLFIFSITVNLFATNCDESILVFDNIQKKMNLSSDLNYYSKRVLTLETFCKVASKLARLYPAQNGIKIKYQAMWDLPDPNARANYNNHEGHYLIEIYGGLLNLPHFTEGALAAVTCHELGHIKGGTKESRIFWDGKKQLLNTSEGFADYFASQICLKKYYEDRNFTEVPRIERISNICQYVQKKQLCINVLNASYDYIFSTSNEPINLNISSTFTASHTSHTPQNHPKHECRFDIMISGYRCPLNMQDIPCGFNKKGRYTGKGSKESLPPRCFFKP